MGPCADHTAHALARCWYRRTTTLCRNLIRCPLGQGPHATDSDRQWHLCFDGQALVEQLQEMLKLQEEQRRRLSR